MSHERMLRRRIKWLTSLFIAGLVVSGVTAIPLRTEVAWLTKTFSQFSLIGGWLQRVSTGLDESARSFPFLFYGIDWLAFGHFVIAIAFIGALRDPVRNLWLFDFGLIACGLVIPYAIIFGGVRGIPFWWRLIDCSFGVVGFVPLWFCRRWSRELEQAGSGWK
jgi:hypothetical protein